MTVRVSTPVEDSDHRACRVFVPWNGEEITLAPASGAPERHSRDQELSPDRHLRAADGLQGQVARANAVAIAVVQSPWHQQTVPRASQVTVAGQHTPLSVGQCTQPLGHTSQAGRPVAGRPR